jgi:hypothetical protein
VPYFSPLTDTLLVNGVDIQAFPWLVVESLSGLHSPGTRRGSNDTVPMRRGQLGARLELDAYAFTIPVTVLPIDFANVVSSDIVIRRATMLANVHDLSRLLNADDGLVTLTRRFTTASAPYMTDQSARGQLVDGLAFELLNADTGRTELQFVNLDGCWYAEPVSVAPGTFTIAGDVPTRDIVLTLPGPGTLTSATTGDVLSVTTAATLDVGRFIASAGLSTITATGDRSWFTLTPGPNVVTWTGTGTPGITYRAAFL